MANFLQHSAGVAVGFGSGDADKDGISDKKDKCPDVRFKSLKDVQIPMEMGFQTMKTTVLKKQVQPKIKVVQIPTAMGCSTKTTPVLK